MRERKYNVLFLEQLYHEEGKNGAKLSRVITTVRALRISDRGEPDAPTRVSSR